MTSYKKLQKISVDFRDERMWEKFHLPKNMIIGLFVEAGELAEHFLYKNDDEVLIYIKEKKVEVADELVDVLWWTLLIANDFDIDLGYEFCRKMKINLKENPNKSFKIIKMEVPEYVESLSEMQNLIRKFRTLRGWEKNNHPRDLLLKLIEEIGELSRYLQWKKGSELTEYLKTNQMAVADEVVDVLICILMLFENLKYNIETEFERKMSKNRVKYPIK